MGLAKGRGRGPSSIDALIAATAIADDLTLVTRNSKDLKASAVHSSV